MMKTINRYIPELVNDYLNRGKHVHIKWNKDLTTELYNLDKEGLTVACDTILRISGTRDTDKKNFVEIPYDNFRKILHDDYKLYLDYLIESKIILTDNHYIKGEKATSYKINEEYMSDSELETIKIEDKLINKRTLKAIKETNMKLKPTRRHKDNYLKTFKIDYDRAIQFLISCYLNKTPDHKGRILDKYTKAILQHKLLQIKNGELWISRSHTNGRINSNLTSLNGDYKRFIVGYDWSLDIVSSQPLLVNVLINLIEYLQTSDNSEGVNNIHIHLLSYVSKILQKSLGKSDLQRLINELKNVKIPHQKERETWRNLCESGRLYEHFQRIISERMSIQLTRQAAKQIVITTMYSDSALNTESKKSFNATFPQTYKFTSDIKKILNIKRRHRILSLILQAIESYIWCERILPELDIMKVDYLFIHDSIIVKDRDLERSEEKIKEIYNKFQTTPNIKIEKLK